MASNSGSPSTITFGGEPENATEDKTYFMHKITTDAADMGTGMWTLPLKEWQIGGKKQKTVATTFVMFDPMAYTQMPTADYNIVKDKFLAATTGTGCTTFSDGSNYCYAPIACSTVESSFPSMAWKFDTTTYTIPPASFLYEWSNSVTGLTECILTIQPG